MNSPEYHTPKSFVNLINVTAYVVKKALIQQ